MKIFDIFKVILFIAIAAFILLSQIFWDAGSAFSQAQIERWLVSAGRLAPLFYMAVMALAVIISPIPSLPLDIAAGAFFGPLQGTIYSVVGALCGAAASFMIARILGRQLIEKVIGGHINFCTKCSDRVLTKIIILSRLLPLVSFDVISYGAGLTKMSLKNFILATLFGMIPLTFIYNYFGSVLVLRRGESLVLGVIMVILFFLVPRWMEKKGLMDKIKHE